MSEINEQLQEFAVSLNEDVREKAEARAPFPTEEECFAGVVLEMFEDAGVVEESEVCVHAGRIGRSNFELAGWAFPPSEEEDLSQLSILAILFTNEPTPIPISAEDLRRRFDLVVNFVKAALAGKADELEPATSIAALARIVYARRSGLKRIAVHLATDGLTQRLKEIDSVSVDDLEITCSIWDIERLSRLSDPKQEEIDIDVVALLGKGLPCLRIPEEDPHYSAYLCVVPGTLLYYAYEQYGQRLLELNVRAFLSATGKVNRGIRDTIKTQPDRFFPFNNGLALTARRVEVETDESGHDYIARVVGLQIVNGGQTTASIHRAWKLDGAEEQVRKVFVQGKLTVITTAEGDDESFIDLVRNISKFANSQNAVKDDDLEANQPWHVRFENLSRTVWTPDARSLWFYERSRGSYATAKLREATTRARKIAFEIRWPRSQLVTKTDLAKCWNAWAQRPEIVSLGGQKNFKQFMAALDDQVRRPTLDETEYRRIVGKVILFRDTTKVVNALKDQIPAYRAQVTAYLVSYLSFRMPGGLDFDRIWERQAVPETVKDVLKEWAVPLYARILTTANGRNVSEWCKKSECWSAIRSLSLKTEHDLSRFSANQTAGAPTGLIDNDDAAAISECLRLTIADWEELCTWSMTDQSVHFTVRGILSTLRSYALQNWTRRPSPKQARAASRVIQRWRTASASLGAAELHEITDSN